MDWVYRVLRERERVAGSGGVAGAGVDGKLPPGTPEYRVPYSMSSFNSLLFFFFHSFYPLIALPLTPLCLFKFWDDPFSASSQHDFSIFGFISLKPSK